MLTSAATICHHRTLDNPIDYTPAQSFISMTYSSHNGSLYLPLPFTLFAQSPLPFPLAAPSLYSCVYRFWFYFLFVYSFVDGFFFLKGGKVMDCYRLRVFWVQTTKFNVWFQSSPQQINQLIKRDFEIYKEYEFTLDIKLYHEITVC